MNSELMIIALENLVKHLKDINLKWRHVFLNLGNPIFTNCNQVQSQTDASWPFQSPRRRKLK
jgi:hypothetical protein